MNSIRIRKSALLGTSALAFALFSSGAWAQTCTNFIPTTPGGTAIGNTSGFAGFATSAASSLSASIANMQTVFLGNQTSAFVANPGGAGPNEQGGGVWARGVGGEATIKSTSGATVTFTSAAAGAGPFALPAVNSAGNVNCFSRERDSFAGVQVGTDVARLNLDGWNFNMGVTAGYLESHNRERNITIGLPGAPRTNFEVPFVGAYAVATKGGFFADINVRGEFYNIEVNNPGADFFNQPFGAKGMSISTSVGYQWALANNWFVEPSAGFTYSRTQVDPFSAVGLPPTQQFSGTVAVNNIDSELARATVRVGTSFNTGSMILQPFASASVFHEFGGPTDATFQTCVNCVVLTNNVFVAPASINVQSNTTRIGTYGQFSGGIAGQVINTGWVGFVRGDYRTGDHIEGWTATGGLRYNFLPTPVAPVITKGPVVPAVPAVVNWTGFYVGGFLGADWGSSRVHFVNDGFTTPRIQGIIGGGQVGYNWQMGHLVLGVEGDVGATNKHGARRCGGASGFGPGDGVFTSLFFACKDDLDWVATVAGRVGFTIDRALLYVKAGGAWTNEKFTATCIAGPRNGIDAFCFSPAGLFSNGFTARDGTRTGGVVGLGSEFALTPFWSAKAEYNYIDFGKDTVRFSDGSLGDIRTHINEVKVGVNYHFGPMSAR
jgi:opacity protein-like surface antigen